MKNEKTLKKKICTNSQMCTYIYIYKKPTHNDMCKGDVQRRHYYKQVLTNVLHGFLLPNGYGGHEHEWLQVDIDFCICRLCGKEHVCSLATGSECVVEECEHNQRVCTLTGYVLSTTELCLEWGGIDRLSFSSSATKKRPVAAAAKQYSLVSALHGVDLAEQVLQVVTDLLQSPQTSTCTHMELQRKRAKEVSTFMRIIREYGRDQQRRRPCMLRIVAHMHWVARKVRVVHRARPAYNARMVRMCAESITGLLHSHGWVRVQKQLTHPVRRREFICSILYLMRMGITYKQRCLLPRVPELELLLPQQVFLPMVFGIRAKSITEGENIIKLDIRRCCSH